MAIDPKLLTELAERRARAKAGGGEDKLEARRKKGVMTARDRLCLLYTSDAADDLPCVDLGGRRITKKNTHNISIHNLTT